MAFDFPNAPTTGQVANGYAWDGEKWKGGIPGVAGPLKEQFFDLSGKTQQDITVPTWAKGAIVTGSCWMAAVSNAMRLRMSLDGTTFLTGATDYNYGGPLHYTGTTNYATVPFTGIDSIPLTAGSDNANFPHAIQAEITLGRPDTSAVLGYTKIFSKSYDNAAGSLGRTFWYAGYPNVVPSGSNLAVKALRFYAISGAWRTGSYLHVRWLGDDAQMPVSNAIPEAPNDGYYWLRRNNAWERFKGVIQDTQAIDATSLSATTSESALGAPMSFTPLLPDSRVIWQMSAYCMIQSTAAGVDDVRGRIYGKYYDNSAYQATIATAIMGQVNALASATQAYYYRITCSPAEVGSYRRAGTGVITMRPYGLADYANVTLNCYDSVHRFWEIQV